MVPRIRSLHPGQWTDEAFVSCSPLARLLALGLRNEADDHGVFEWKPVTLKMRVLPVDDVSVEELLKELADTGQVVRFEESDRTYGAIRNFLKYQRPKSPKKLFPLPERLQTVVGLHLSNVLLADGSEAGEGRENLNSEIPRVKVLQFPQSGEIPSQMKDEGGRMKEVKKEKVSCRKRVSYAQAFEEVWKAYPTDDLMSKKATYEGWKRLSEEDRQMLVSSIAPFRAYCSAHPDYRPVHFVRFITQRRFESFKEKAQQFRERAELVFVKYDSPQWRAWDKHLRQTEGRGASYSQRTMGWEFPTEWPPKTPEILMQENA